MLKGGFCKLDACSDVVVDPVHSGDQVISVDLRKWDRSKVTRMVSD
jgi:hypothetical protein